MRTSSRISTAISRSLPLSLQARRSRPLGGGRGGGRRIVTRIATERGVRRAVKSKSMVSEEIRLNDGLEAAGVTVVETDLGEWVVQLAHDHPSHIIAPIIHKSARTSPRSSGRAAGATDDDVADVAHMTAFARRTPAGGVPRRRHGHQRRQLRRGRDRQPLPRHQRGQRPADDDRARVHVALMGIERIVPTMADLGVMLRVLARSATGQPLSVYSNILTGPRRVRRRR